MSAGYIPPFFPDNTNVPSPISKQDTKVCLIYLFVHDVMH